jgi:hypothetical protein
MGETRKETETLEYIAGRIKGTMDTLGITVREASAVLHPVMGIAFSTATGYLTDVRRGQVIFSYDRHVSRGNKLRWLSILTYSLGIGEEDDLVARTRELYPLFQFPPPEDQRLVLTARPRPKNPYDGLTLRQKLKHLRPRDRELLERTVDSLLVSYVNKRA